MFIFTWMFDKLGYMPKIEIEVGKVNFEPKIPDLEEPKPRVRKTRPLPSKATRAKTALTKKVK
jgi:hypothetical protein